MWKRKKAPRRVLTGKDLEYARKVKADRREAKRMQEVYKAREEGFKAVRENEKPLAIDDNPSGSGANGLQPTSCLHRGSWDKPGINRDRRYRYDGPMLSP